MAAEVIKEAICWEKQIHLKPFFTNHTFGLVDSVYGLLWKKTEQFFELKI